MTSGISDHIQPLGTIALGQFQAAVGFDLRRLTPEELVARVGLTTATWEPESVLCSGLDGFVNRIHQDPSGAVVRYGEEDLAFGFAPGGPARCAAVGVAEWTRGWAVGVMSDAPGIPDGEVPDIGDEGRRIAFLPVDRRLRGESDPAVVVDAFEAGKPVPGTTRVRLAWLFRCDVDTCAADGDGEPRYATNFLTGDARVVVIGGVIEESQRLVNTLTGRSFRHLRVRVGDDVIDACAPEREGGPDYSPGRIIRGAALPTGFTDEGPGNPGIISNDAFLEQLEFVDPPTIVMGSAMHVLADPADCLGLPIRDAGDVAARLFGGRGGHRMRAEEEVIVGMYDEGVPTTQVYLGRQEDDGIGIAVSVPEGYWGAYVDGARIGDRSRLHLAGVDVLVTESRDTELISSGAGEFEAMCRDAFRRAVAYQREREARARLVAADPSPFADSGVDVLDVSALPEVIPDNDRADGPPPPLAHGTRIPVCARILDVRWRPTLLNNVAGRDPDDMEPEYGRMEVGIEVEGLPATLHLPGDANVVPVGGHVFGWAQVCGNDKSLSEVTGSRSVDGFPDRLVRPFVNGYEDDDVPPGELLAMAGPIVDQCRAMMLTSCGPVTAPQRLLEIAESLGLRGEVGDDFTFRLRPGLAGAHVLPIDERGRRLLLRLVERALREDVVGPAVPPAEVAPEGDDPVEVALTADDPAEVAPEGDDLDEGAAEDRGEVGRRCRANRARGRLRRLRDMLEALEPQG